MLKCPSCGTSSVGESNFCAKCGYALQGATGRLDADSLLEDRYVITGLLGRGGMGAVYKALDLRLNKSVVAIKEMSTAALGPGKLEKALAVFKQEASMLIKLRHPSLPRVTDFFSAGEDRWYLVMDCIEGETLEALAGSQGKIPEKEVIGWALQLCDVLDYLHGRDPPVIFRDLKPANIMLTLKHEIKLIDFGIARHFNPDTSADTMSFASIGFAPPEQFGEGQTDPRSDIFSLGATLHYLVTGLDPAKNPFKYDRPDRVAPVSTAFSDLIMEMLELEPGNRPQGVALIKKKLQGIPVDGSAAPPTEFIEPGPVKGPPGAATELFLTEDMTAELAEQGLAEEQAPPQSAAAPKKKTFSDRVKSARARRYEIIQHNRQEHWLDGSPVLLAAHALVKDNLTGGVSAQCKFQNLGKEKIEAVYLSLSCAGADREAVASISEYIYLDLAAKPGLTFGDDRLIPLPDRTTRYYTITLHKVVFAGGVVWQNAGAKAFAPSPEPQPLSALGYLEEEYRRIAPSELQANFPQRHALSWRCGCGQLNLKEVSNCVKCGHDLESQLLASDKNRLEAELARSLEQIKEQERLEMARIKAARERKIQKRERAILKLQKAMKVILPVLAVVIVIIIGYAIWVNSDAYKSTKYDAALSLLESGSYGEAAIAFAKLGDYKESTKKLTVAREGLNRDQTVAAGGWHTVGLKSDGRVVAVGNNQHGQCDLSGWSDIVAVASGRSHTVGLKSDGRVVAVGDNDYGQCDLSNWSDIVAVAAGYSHTIGLKSDGRVVAAGYNGYGQCDFFGWSNIVAIAAGGFHTVGLKSDGRVVAVGNNDYGQCGLSNWSDIVAVAAGGFHTVGLKQDGQAVALGRNRHGQCDLSGWSNIAAVAAGGLHTVGLKSNGRVIAVGSNDYGQCNLSDRPSIVVVAAGSRHTVGLKSDGSVVAVGNTESGRCDLSGWSDIRTKW